MKLSLFFVPLFLFLFCFTLDQRIVCQTCKVEMFDKDLVMVVGWY